MNARRVAFGFVGFATVIAGALLFEALSGPSKEDEFTTAAKAAIAAKLLQPESADFRSLRLYDTSGSPYKRDILCGEVNARNSLGSYIGFKRFSAERFESGEWIIAIENSDLVDGIPFKVFGRKCFPKD